MRCNFCIVSKPINLRLCCPFLHRTQMPPSMNTADARSSTEKRTEQQGSRVQTRSMRQTSEILVAELLIFFVCFQNTCPCILRSICCRIDAGTIGFGIVVIFGRLLTTYTCVAFCLCALTVQALFCIVHRWRGA